MSGSRKFQLRFLSVLVALLSLSSVFADLLHEQAKEEYVEWVRNMSLEDGVQAAVYGPEAVDSYTTGPSVISITVNPTKGKGTFQKVQKAIDSIPDHSTTQYIVYIAPGVYKERLNIPAKKGPITLQGAGMTLTKITFGLDSAEAGGTMASSSVSVSCDNFIAKDIAFENTSPSPPPGAVGLQAVAFMIDGDKGAFYRCAFLGFQDTLYDKQGRHYWKDCYVRGTIDFIFGNGTSYYETCYLDSVATSFGSLTAQKRGTRKATSGFSFVNCTVNGTGYSYLGRAWGPSSRVVFIETYLSAAIRPEGWYDWGISARDKTVFYGEYKCYGPGSDRSGRAPWSLELTDAQVQPFLTTSFIQGSTWLPKGPQ